MNAFIYFSSIYKLKNKLKINQQNVLPEDKVYLYVYFYINDYHFICVNIFNLIINLTWYFYFQNDDGCLKFKILSINISESYYLGVIVVNGDIQYSENQFYKLLLVASVSN